jgi:4-amino-4-deoxy-L-arabinose transferase-like glycosyltransferase
MAVAITSSPGPGLDPDSASYLGAAESLAKSDGYRIPIADWLTRDSTSALAHFPPGYPTAIALMLRAGLPPMSAARAVNAAAVFVGIALTLWLVASVSGLTAGIAVTLALFAMPAFVEQHLSVLSEPLFLACIIGALGAMMSASRQSEEREVLKCAVIAGIAAALAMLTRYAGAAIVGAVALWMLWRPGAPVARLRRAVASALPAIALVGWWLIHLHLTSGARDIRTLNAYGGFLETVRMGIDTIVAWMVPLMSDQTLPGREWLALIAIVALVGITVSGYRTSADSLAKRTIGATITIASCYVVVLVASRLLADPGIPFDNRLLAPLFLLTAIIAAIGIREWWRQHRLPARVACGALLMTWFAASATVTQDEVSWALENGQDFAQDQWSKSPLLAWAQSNAPSRPLYTNWPAAVFFYLHRTSHEMPRDGTAELLRAFADTVRARNGVVIVFDQPSPDQIGAEALQAASGLRQTARVADGSVFTALP